MKKLLLIFITLSLTTPAMAQYTRGHYRSNGSYVQGYHRTRTDGNIFNNYSTRGNLNPYTGRTGRIKPYSQTSFPKRSLFPRKHYQY